MNFLRFLATLHNPVTDFIFSLVTEIGGELGFMVLAILLLWCIDKRQGYYVLFTCFIGTMMNQVLKLAFRVERPWVRDPSFRDMVSEHVREEASGYSFPSGHTQNVTGSFGALAMARPRSRRKAIICVSIIVAVAFSRMYLLVHTPADVGLSLVLGVLLVLALNPIFATEERMARCMPYLLLGAYLLTVANLIYAFHFPAHLTDGANLYSAQKSTCTMHGCSIGAAAVYFMDRRYLHFPTDGRWYAQLIKVVLGLSLVLAIKSLTSAPLTALCFGNEFVSRAIRYALIVIFAGVVWPLTFPFFSRLRIPFLEKKVKAGGSSDEA